MIQSHAVTLQDDNEVSFVMLLARSVCTLTDTNNRYTLSYGHVFHEDDHDSLRGMLIDNSERKQLLLDSYQQHCLNGLFEVAPTASLFILLK